VKIKEKLTENQFSCPSFILDKKWNAQCPENDKFFLVKMKDLKTGNSFFDWLHESQQKAFVELLTKYKK
jgi:hypothetical protein